MSLTVVAKKDVEEFMKKCGVSVDKESLDIFFKQIEGKTVVDAIKDGEKKLPKMPHMYLCLMIFMSFMVTQIKWVPRELPTIMALVICTGG